MKRGKPIRFLSIFIAIFAAINSFPARAWDLSAATIVVNTTVDELNPTSNGLCSLREAIRAANLDHAVGGCIAGSGRDTISLPVGVYTLSLAGALEDESLTGDLDIRSEMIIRGNDPLTTIIDGGGIDRVLHIKVTSASRQVEIIGVTIQNGLEQTDVLRGGGGVFNESGHLTLGSDLPNRYVVIKNNMTNRLGGGINNVDRATLLNVQLLENQAEKGGGIFNESPHTSTDGTIEIIDSVITANNAEISGGAMDNSGIAGLNGVELSGNGAGDDGGAVFSDGSLEIVDSYLHDNSAVEGGGIYNAGYSLLQRSTFESNISTNGGGLYNMDNLTIENTTIGTNTASESGGGLYNDGLLNVFNSTIAYNSSGVFLDPAILPASFHNSMLVDNSGGNCSGTGDISPTGVNLDSQNTCGFSISNVDPLLLPLATYVGSTPLYALAENSPAIDVGDNQDCLAIDQRGVSRPADGNEDFIKTCDIGSFEVEEEFSSRILIPIVCGNVVEQ